MLEGYLILVCSPPSWKPVVIGKHTSVDGEGVVTAGTPQ